VPLPRLIGHRGAPRERPENTLPAFLRALELGADGIELDVHATRDGTVVVHHDPIPRAAPGDSALARRPIASLALDELREFRVAYDTPIPTLGEVLQLIDGRVEVFVEIKGRDIETLVVEEIRRSSMADRCAVHAFDHRVVQHIRAAAPEIRGGALLVSRLIDPVRAMRDAGALDLWPQHEYIDAELVNEVHEAGGRVIAWSVNDPDVARTLAGYGVDGLCTDALPSIHAALGS
jgi:glycerophosphoryl diester phosphodiesterase